MNASLLGRTKPCIFRLSLTASLTHWVDYRLIYFAALRDVKLAGKITLTVNAQRSVPRLDKKLQGSADPSGGDTYLALPREKISYILLMCVTMWG
jgi:hypothetical protein